MWGRRAVRTNSKSSGVRRRVVQASLLGVAANDPLDTPGREGAALTLEDPFVGSGTACVSERLQGGSGFLVERDLALLRPLAVTDESPTLAA